MVKKLRRKLASLDLIQFLSVDATIPRGHKNGGKKISRNLSPKIKCCKARNVKMVWGKAVPDARFYFGEGRSVRWEFEKFIKNIEEFTGKCY